MNHAEEMTKVHRQYKNLCRVKALKAKKQAKLAAQEARRIDRMKKSDLSSTADQTNEVPVNDSEREFRVVENSEMDN